MAPLTVELIRRKAEHNEGLIHTLEEISLHQEEIEEITTALGSNCRRLKILYLQNNIISKMENLHHLKELEYLNLALNNITVIEGLRSCEFLQKLDLTVNFIDLDTLERSIKHLQSRTSLRDLYMIGNPAQASWEGFENYIIGMLPQLERLDGKEITRSKRIVAERALPALEAELKSLAVECERRKEEEGEVVKADAKDGGDGEDSTKHTPEARTQIYRELAEQKRETEERKRENLPRERDYEKEHADSVRAARDRESDGNIRQCNEGKLEFSFDEEGTRGSLVLDVGVPRFLDSSLIDLDVHPHYISIIIKGKVLRLCLPVEVKAGESSAQRSKTTGHLVITMPKVNEMEMVGIRKSTPASSCSKPGRKTGPRVSVKEASTSLASLLLQEAQAARKLSSKARANELESAPTDGGGILKS